MQIPGRELRLVVDLQESGAGDWVGSIIVPGLGVKGAALSNIEVSGREVTFDVAHALGDPKVRPPSFRARIETEAAMVGEMSQGGHVAELSLARVGPAQVDRPPRSTPVSAAVEGQWSGEFELGGYPRHVTITVENHDETGATAEFVIVGKQTNRLPVDARRRGRQASCGSSRRRRRSTSKVASTKNARQISGTVDLGAIEMPLVLHRVAGERHESDADRTRGGDLLGTGAACPQAMFRGDAAHTGVYRDAGPQAVPSRQMEVPDRRPRSSRRRSTRTESSSSAATTATCTR